MNIKKLHCFAGKRWSGDATSALNSALTSGGIVLTEGDEEIEQRLRRSGIEDVRRLNMSGIFGSLNLSRILRLTMPDEVFVYSSEVLSKFNQALSLAKMPQVKIIDKSMEYCLPDVEPIETSGVAMIWIGYITKECGLRSLLEAMKEIPEPRLKVVGVGEAKIVSPLLKLSRSQELSGRIEWVGEKDDVFAEMKGCKLGIITSANPQNKMIYHEFRKANLPVICAETPEQLKQEISRYYE